MSEKPRVSVSAICRDESEYMRQFLEYTHTFADECILVDSGSTDGTKEIVEEYQKKGWNIRFEYRDLNGDFAAQRAFSKSLCTGDWIVMLDIDEKFTNSFVRLLPELMSWSYIAYSFGTFHLTKGAKHYSNHEDDPHVRMFRNLPNITFQKPIHEVVTLDGNVLSPHKYDASHIVHYMDEIKLLHYGRIKSLQSLEKKQKIWNTSGFIELSNSVQAPITSDHFLQFASFNGDTFPIDFEKYD